MVSSKFRSQTEVRVPDKYKRHLANCKRLWRAFGPGETDYHFTYLWTLDQILRDNGFGLVDELRDYELAMARLASMDELDLSRLFNALNKCFVDGQWEDFINLDIVESDDEIYAQSGRACNFVTGWKATVRSWTEPYRGDVPESLWNHVMRYYRQSEDSVPYANVCAVVQSSGMGKSRAIDELGKMHLVLPMCVRKGSSGYPPPDVQVREFLTLSVDEPVEARCRCLALLHGLFRRTLHELKVALGSEIAKTRNGLIRWFHDKISPPEDNEYRRRFFEGVLSIALSVKIRIENYSDERDESIERAVQDAIVHVQTSAGELVEFLRGTDPLKTTDEVEVFIALDEAHILGDSKNAYRRTEEATFQWSVLSVFQEAFDAVYKYPVWALLISTSGSISRPTLRCRNSLATNKCNVELSAVPVFTGLQYDVFAPRVGFRGDETVVIKEGRDIRPSTAKTQELDGLRSNGLTLAFATSMKVMAHFGRPMFALRYDYGDDTTRANILEFAMEKLICNSLAVLSPKNNLAVPREIPFAILSQRLQVELDVRECGDDEERQVEAHMRVLLRLDPIHRTITSTSGSEPLLAEGAATIMMSDVIKPARTLTQVLNNFSIKKDSCDELVGMLAVSLARDAVVKLNMESIHPMLLWYILQGRVLALLSDTELEQRAFRAVAVSGFMRALFGLEGIEQLDDFASDFKDSYLHFNHFVKAKTLLTFTLRFLMLYMVRGAALHCASCVPEVDFVLPVLFGVTLREDHMSVVLVRTRYKGAESPKDVFRRMDQTVVDLFEGTPVKRPVIRIIFALDSEPKLKYTKSIITREGKSYAAHDFWCGGIGKHFLPGRSEDDKAWHTLISATAAPESRDHGEGSNVVCEAPPSLRAGENSDPSFWPWVHGLL